jgi:hypothetical protein
MKYKNNVSILELDPNPLQKYSDYVFFVVL